MDGQVHATGQLHIQFFENGAPTHDLHVKNLVVDSGLNWMAARLAGGGDSIATMGIGIGTNAAAAGDTALQAQVARLAAAAVASGKTLVSQVTFEAGSGTGNITELALFLASGGLYARTVIPAQPKGSTTSMQVKWTITLNP